MPPLRSRRPARPSTGNRPDPPRRSALTAPTERNAGSVGDCGHRHGQFGRVLSAQTASECPQEVPGGKERTCRGRKRQKSTCVPRSALAKAGALSWPSFAAAGAGCGQPPGGAEQQQPALSGRGQGCRPPLQRRLGPTRPAPSPARPSAGQLKGSGLRQTIVTCRRSLRPGGSVCGQPRRVPGQAVCTCPGAGAGGLGGRSSPGAAAARQRRVPRRPRRQAHELRLPCAAVGIAATGRAGARFS